MTLRQLLHAVEVTASNQPAVEMIVRSDVFRLNAAPDAKYGVFAWLQGQHSVAPYGSLNTYRFTFFYVDRLTADKSNETEVQSTGIEVLTNIVRALENQGIECPDRLSFQAFNQRFSDECAGVFCTVALEVPSGDICPEGYADFNQDFNEDFMIW